MKLPCRDSAFIFFSGILIAFYATCVIVPVIMTVIEEGIVVPLILFSDLSTYLFILSWVVYKKCKEIEFIHAIKLKPNAIEERKDNNFNLLLLCLWIEHCADLDDIHHRFILIDGIFEAAFKEIFRELLEFYDHDGISVSMKDPRDCSYHNRTKVERLGETIPAEKAAPNGGWYRKMLVEMRGITLRQLRAVYANAKRRCVEEKWVDWKGQPITPETLNLYHINEYIIKPFTMITQRSFVESLPSTAGTQPPRWFVSHWWGEPFSHTLDCISTHVHDFRKNWDDSHDARGGGMTEDTPLWICAFANNQWALDEDMATDPKKSSFTKAMEVACFRTISILDGAGTVFTRIWCVFELFLTLILDKNVAGLWVVYTARRHRYVYKHPDNPRYDVDEDRVAVGIIPGGAPNEWNSAKTSGREKYFPFKVILDSLNKINILSAEASVPADRTRIMNSVIESDDIDATPPKTHEKYDKLNDSVKASFVYSLAVLNAAHNAGRDVWKSTVTILSKGTMTGRFVLNFSVFSPRLSSSKARELVSHVPLTCTGLRIGRANGEDGKGAIDGLLEWLEKKEANSLTYLNCHDSKVCDDEKGRAAGSRLASALASNHAQSMEVLAMRYMDLIDSGNVSEWKSALKKMTNLKRLLLEGTGLSEDEKEILEIATHAEDVRIS